MSESKRLFFAVNIPEEVKGRIAKELLPLIPAADWGKVPQENLHVTMLFLGHLPAEAIGKLREQAEALKNFRAFEAELRGIGQFNGRVLWLGVGKGESEFKGLCEKLQEAVGVRDPRFHPHITLARNRGAGGKEAGALAEKMMQAHFSAKISVKSVELMESILRQPAPEYAPVFSAGLSAAARQT